MGQKAYRVLFVDDDTDLLSGLRAALRKAPFEVITATSADGAAAILRSGAVEVVVSDERMPGVEGSRFLAFVKRNFPETIRISLTGQASVEAMQRAINDAEIYRLLLKPCTAPELQAVIEAAMAERRSKPVAARGQGGGPSAVDDNSQDESPNQTRAAPDAQQSPAGRKTAAMDALERNHPGIGHVSRDKTGAVLLQGPSRVLRRG